MKLLAIGLVIFTILLGILGPQAFFIVDETQSAIVTRFGEPRRTIRSAGINVKTPFVDTVTYFDKRRKLFDAPADSLLTSDKKRLVIDVYAIARVTDPLVFFRRVRTEQGAITASLPIIGSGLREEVARDEQSQIIKLNREEIMKSVTIAVSPLLEEFGLAVVDVRVKRIDFPPEIAPNIFQRMQAERKRKADAERAEGAKRDLEIRANVDRQVTVIEAEAERDANILRGEGEAEAIRIFADALEEGPEFYAFQRSLQAYKMFLPQNTTVVLPADSDLFQFLQSPLGLNGGAGGATARASTGLSEFMKVETAARTFLDEEMSIDSASPTLAKIERVDWSDGSLGCPAPGVSYTQAIVPGFNLVFDNGGESVEVHSNLDGSRLTACSS
jgi:membrane protease subunit HflC